MESYQQNAKNHLISKGMTTRLNQGRMIFWQGRYALEFLASNENNYTFKVTDLFHHKEKEVFVQKRADFDGFFALSGKFVLIAEKDYDSKNCFLRLMYFDPQYDEIYEIHSIERNGFLDVYVDSANSKKFILRNCLETYECLTQMCSLVNGKIEIGKEVEWNVDKMETYSNGQLLSFCWYRNVNGTRHVTIRVFDLEKNLESIYDVDPLPYGVQVWKAPEFNSYTWIHNCCFISIKFILSQSYGIAFTDSNTRKWTVLEFASKFPIEHLQSNNICDLMVYAEGNQLNKCLRKKEEKIYKIPMSKPKRLRFIAWFKLIELFEHKKANDPHQKALECLPLTSDIQPFRCLQ